VQAESEVLGNSILAPLYRRLRSENQDSPKTTSESPARDSSGRETPA